MAEKVGEIYYDVTLDTKELIVGQRVVDREVKKTSDSLGGLSTKLTAAAAAVAVLAAAYAALNTAKLADEFRLLGARVEVAAGSIEAGAAAMNELVAISRRTQSSLAGNIEVFARLNQSIKQMGGTQQDTLQITELLAKAIKVSGANAVEAKAAMLQFGQALGSGKLAGDELRSLLETAPYLMRQLADGIGVPVGALKKLGEEGKLTADVVTNALTKAATQIDADFKKFPQTIESAMVVAQDSAALAALKFDELTGTSAALTGVTKGLGETLDRLADEFGAANDEAGKLGRNDSIATWAQGTRVALSYLVDAADLTWQALSVLGRNVGFVFQGVGDTIAAYTAVSSRLLRGDIEGAKAIGEAYKQASEQRRAALDAADAKTLSSTKLAGQRMREAWEQGAGGGRGFVNPGMGTASALKSPGGAESKKGAKFDSAGYLAGLEKTAKEGVARVDAIETEALRKNAALLAAGKISLEQSERAKTLIMKEAADERLKLLVQDGAERADILEKDRERERDTAKKLAEDQKRGQGLATDLITGEDPIAKLQAELQTKSELLLQAFMIDQQNEALYAAAKVALEQQTADKIREIREKQAADEQARQSQQLTNYSNLFGSIADVTKAFAGKQSGVYKALFVASKAFAVADSVIKIQQGIAGVLATEATLPQKLAGAALIASSGANLLGTIKGANYGGGRQYGGPVNAGSMYRVGEGNRPEMFVGDSGRSYMIPGEKGKVIGNGDLAGGGSGPAWQIIINNAPPGTTASVNSEARIIEIAVAQAEAKIAGEISQNTGRVYGAMTGSTNVRGRL